MIRPECATEGCSNSAHPETPLGAYCTRCTEEIEALGEQLNRADSDEGGIPLYKVAITVGLMFLVFVALSIGAQLGRIEEQKRWVTATGCSSHVACDRSDNL